MRRDLWWLGVTWLRHRQRVCEMHPLLVELQDARGPAFLTCGHVLDVLDANDPDALVRSWMAGTPTARMNGVGLLVRSCAWQEGDEPCDRPVRTVNAKFCEAHAAASAAGQSERGSGPVVEKVTLRQPLGITG